MSDEKNKLNDNKNAADPAGANSQDSEETIEIVSASEAMSAPIAKPAPLPQQQPATESADKTTDTQPSASETRQAEETKSKPSVKQLSSEQVQNIASRFNSDHEVASETDREQLLKALGSDGNKRGSSATKPTPSSTERQSEISKSATSSTSQKRVKPTRHSQHKKNHTPAKGPARGIAYYSGRTIKLSAAEQMTAGSEVIVGGNRYQLKPGNPNSRVLSYVVTTVLIVASAFVGKYYLAEGQQIGGEVVGIALNQHGDPYQDGAVVRLPELGFSTVTNRNGLFHLSDIPNGTYKLEYNLAGSLGGSQLVTVRDDEATMVTLDGPTKRLAQSLIRTPKNNPTPRATTTSKSNSTTKSNSTAKSNSKSSSSRGALAVTSNVKGAVVYIGNQKLGKVNRTFRRMNTGDRTIRIEKTGYEPYVASVNIAPGKIAKVNVTLVPLAVIQEPESAPELSAAELFEAGREAFGNGDNDAAVERLNQALEKDPSIADAYFFRAEALAKLGNTNDAQLDYIRAGEIWSRQKRTQDALSAFDNAVEVSGGSALAYKVRGDFFVSKRSRERGISDYHQAIQVEKKYYDAHLALGVALFESGSYRKADKALRRAQDFNDKDPKLYHYLMLNSLAKNDLSDVNRYYKQFKKKATPAEMARFRTDNKLVAIRRIVKD